MFIAPSRVESLSSRFFLPRAILQTSLFFHERIHQTETVNQKALDDKEYRRRRRRNKIKFDNIAVFLFALFNSNNNTHSRPLANPHCVVWFFGVLPAL
jgi:hypothetical protein